MTQICYGTKKVSLTPMTRLEYNNFRGWALPPDENGDDPGYRVEYLDGGKPNVDGFEGYISWSPKEQADKAYGAHISRAKFQLRSIAEHMGGLKRHEFVAVCADEVEENRRFHKYTPNGTLSIDIVNPNVTFEIGKAYYLDFSRADE